MAGINNNRKKSETKRGKKNNGNLAGILIISAVVVHLYQFHLNK